MLERGSKVTVRGRAGVVERVNTNGSVLVKLNEDGRRVVADPADVVDPVAAQERLEAERAAAAEAEEKRVAEQEEAEEKAEAEREAVEVAARERDFEAARVAKAEADAELERAEAARLAGGEPAPPPAP